MTAPKPTWADPEDRAVEESQAVVPEAAPPPPIPDGASQMLCNAVVAAQAAQRNVQVLVATMLATLGLDSDRYDISIIDGKAEVIER